MSVAGETNQMSVCAIPCKFNHQSGTKPVELTSDTIRKKPDAFAGEEDAQSHETCEYVISGLMDEVTVFIFAEQFEGL